MKVRIVYCHPLPDSFCAAMLSTVREVLEKKTDALEVIDLYAEGEGLTGTDAVDTLVLVYPTWWAGMPAELVSWLERFWSDPSYTNLKQVVAVTTHGSPRWVNWLIGRAGQKVVMKGIPKSRAKRCRSKWIGFYSIDRSTTEERQDFLCQVEKKLSKL